MQTVWSQIRLHLSEQPDLGPYYLALINQLYYVVLFSLMNLLYIPLLFLLSRSGVTWFSLTGSSTIKSLFEEFFCTDIFLKPLLLHFSCSTSVQEWRLGTFVLVDLFALPLHCMACFLLVLVHIGLQAREV